MLGHASAKITLDTYGHVLQEDLAEPLEEIAGKLFHDVAQDERTRFAWLAILIVKKRSW